MNSINFSIGGDNSKFIAVVRQTQAIGLRMANRVNLQFGTMTAAIGTFLGGAALRGVRAFKDLSLSIAGGVQKAYDLGGSLSDLSAQTGLASGEALVFQQALKNNGLEAGNLQPTINRLQKVMASAAAGNKSARASFSDIGLEWKKLSKLSPGEQFIAVGSAIADIEDPTERAAASMRIFRGVGGELLALFADKNALATASREIGAAADVLNKKAGVFDTISDKIQNMVPAKMTGLFVGIADSLSEPLLALLERLEQSDLLAKGQEIGRWVIDAAQFAVDSFYTVRKAILDGQEGFALMVGWAGEVVNLLWDGLGRIALIVQATWHGAVSDSKLLVAGLSEGVLAIALDLQTSLQFAFQHVVRFFDDAMGGVIDSVGAGLELAIQKAMEGLAKIPILNKQLGLEGFSAESFGDIKSRKQSERAERQAQSLQSYGELRSENFNNSGWMKSAMSFVDDLKQSASSGLQKGVDALSRAFSTERSQLVDPRTFYDVAAEVRSRREKMLAGQSIPQIASLQAAGGSALPESLSSWEKLQKSSSSWAQLQSGKFGDRSSSLLGASPTLHTESLIGHGAEASKAARERERAAQVERDKDKTPEGTNSRLDKLISTVEEAWGT